MAQYADPQVWLKYKCNNALCSAIGLAHAAMYANPFMQEWETYFFKRRKWREDLAKQCRQITKFAVNDFKTDNSRVPLRSVPTINVGIKDSSNQKIASSRLEDQNPNRL